MQIDSFMDIPEEKRPPKSIWNEPEELKDWIDRVIKKQQPAKLEFFVDEVEG